MRRVLFVITLQLVKDNWHLAYHDPTRSKDHKMDVYKAILINSMDVQSPFAF